MIMYRTYKISLYNTLFILKLVMSKPMLFQTNPDILTIDIRSFMSVNLNICKSGNYVYEVESCIP